MLEECPPPPSEESSSGIHQQKRVHPSPTPSPLPSPFPSPAKTCKHGGECEPIDSKNGSHIYNYFQRVPAFLNAYVNYPRNTWISTRDLARKLDQIEQYTHHQLHASPATENQIVLLDARNKKEYRTSHIHGAIHFPVSSHLCMLVRPTHGHVQKNFFTPTKSSPLRAAQGKPVFDLLRTLDKRTEIVVYCTVGYRSGWIARALQAQGFTAVSLYGGIKKWADEGREMFVFKADKRKDEHSGLMGKIQKLKEIKTSKRTKQVPQEPEVEHVSRKESIHEVIETKEIEEFNAQGMLRKHESMEEIVRPNQMPPNNLTSSQHSD